MRFVVRWPDETVTSCYSPSLAVCDFLEVGASYPVEDFLRRAHAALDSAALRVRDKQGLPSSLTAAELARIDRKALSYAELPESTVTIEAFEPEDSR
jgi:uncharacterized repeat protein (TIGR04042 family)